MQRIFLSVLPFYQTVDLKGINKIVRESDGSGCFIENFTVIFRQHFTNKDATCHLDNVTDNTSDYKPCGCGQIDARKRIDETTIDWR